MIFVMVFAVCFCACVGGAICGIGGGVIIKPALDAFGIMDVSTLSFLSGCTVLAMTVYSVGKAKLSGASRVNPATGIPLALGAAIGGVAGKQMFQAVKAMSGNANQVGAIQAICLLVVTLGTLIYTVKKASITTRQVESKAACVVIGVVLGILSSFLGIGGGPINLVVLFYFFSMDTKAAAETSLYIILFSQVASLLASIVTRTVPDFSLGMLCLMAGGGICGGIVGRSINKKLDAKAVDKLFIALMVLMIFINIYNIDKFL